MAKIPIIQQSFAGGRITEALQSREDLAKQHVALLECRNALITSTGSVENRAGFEFIAEVEDSTKRHRLMSFVFSRLQAYGLVWGDLVLRIIKDGAIVGGDHVSPYLAANNADLYDAQSADVMYLTRSGNKPYKVTRTSDTAWTVTAIDFEDGPWLPFRAGDENITITPSADGGSGVTLTASSAVFGTVGVGDHVRLGYVNPLNISQIYWAWAIVTAVASSTSITVTSQKLFGFEYFLNPEFLDGIGFWQNHSNPLGDATVEHVAATQELRLIRSATPHDAIIRNNVIVAANEDLILSLVVTQVDTSFRVFVGTTAGAADILAAQIVNSTGQKSWTVRPTQADIWVTIDTTGQPSGTHKISRASLKRKDLATQNWRLSAWNSDRGWPTTVTLHEGRLAFGGNQLDQPDTVFETEIGEYERFPFHTPPLDTDGLSYVLGSSEVNAIEWIRSHGELAVGTSGDEWRISAGANSNTITSTSVYARSKSKTGSANVKPVVAGDTLFFLGRNKNKVYALGYSVDSDAYKPIDMTILTPDLFKGYEILEWAFAESPNSVVWCIRDDGKMLSLSYNESQELWGWAVHDTDGLFESVCVVPESTGDTVYVIVNRTIGGATKRYVEMLKTRITDEDIYDWYFVDSGVTWNDPKTISNITKASQAVVTATAHGGSSGDQIRITSVNGMTEVNDKYYFISDETANTFKLKTLGGVYVDSSSYTAYTSGGQVRGAISTLTGLGHLEGKTVVAISDGSVNTPKVVSGGSISLDNPGAVVHGGLSYTTDLKTIPHDYVINETNTSQGKTKTLDEVAVYFNKTRGASVGPDENNLKAFSFNVPGQPDSPAPLFTGVKVKSVEDGANKLLTHTFIRNSDPVPLEVVGIISEVDFSEK